MSGMFPRSFRFGKQVEEHPADRSCFMHVALGMDFQDKRRAVCGGVGGRKRKGVGGRRGRKKTLPWHLCVHFEN